MSYYDLKVLEDQFRLRYGWAVIDLLWRADEVLDTVDEVKETHTVWELLGRKSIEEIKEQVRRPLPLLFCHVLGVAENLSKTMAHVSSIVDVITTQYYPDIQSWYTDISGWYSTIEGWYKEFQRLWNVRDEYGRYGADLFELMTHPLASWNWLAPKVLGVHLSADVMKKLFYEVEDYAIWTKRLRDETDVAPPIMLYEFFKTTYGSLKRWIDFGYSLGDMLWDAFSMWEWLTSKSGLAKTMGWTWNPEMARRLIYELCDMTAWARRFREETDSAFCIEAYKFFKEGLEGFHKWLDFGYGLGAIMSHLYDSWSWLTSESGLAKRMGWTWSPEMAEKLIYELCDMTAWARYFREVLKVCFGSFINFLTKAKTTLDNIVMKIDELRDLRTTFRYDFDWLDPDAYQMLAIPEIGTWTFLLYSKVHYWGELTYATWSDFVKELMRRYELLRGGDLSQFVDLIATLIFGLKGFLDDFLRKLQDLMNEMRKLFSEWSNALSP